MTDDLAAGADYPVVRLVAGPRHPEAGLEQDPRGFGEVRHVIGDCGRPYLVRALDGRRVGGVEGGDRERGGRHATEGAPRATDRSTGFQGVRKLVERTFAQRLRRCWRSIR